MDLLLFTGDTPEDTLQWVLVKNDVVADTGTEMSLSAFTAKFYDADAIPLTVILPGERVASRLMNIPARNATQIRQAASMALEDELAEPIDNLHIAVAGEGVSGSNDKSIMAVPEKWMQMWLDVLHEKALSPHVVTIDFYLLDHADNKGTVLMNEGRIIGNLAGAGFAAEQSFLGQLMPELLKESGCETVQIIHYGGSKISDLPVKVRKLKSKEELASFFVSSFKGKTLPNLLQGKFAPRTDWLALIRPWRMAAILCLVCGVGYLSMIAIEGMRLNKAARNLTSQSEADFAQAFPGVTIRNLSAQARGRIGTSSVSSQDFLTLSSLLSKSSAEVEGVDVFGLSYGNDGVLTADIQFDFDSLAELRNKLSDLGISSTEGRNPRSAGDYFVGKLALRLAS